MSRITTNGDVTFTDVSERTLPQPHYKPEIRHPQKTPPPPRPALTVSEWSPRSRQRRAGPTFTSLTIPRQALSINKQENDTFADHRPNRRLAATSVPTASRQAGMGISRRRPPDYDLDPTAKSRYCQKEFRITPVFWLGGGGTRLRSTAQPPPPPPTPTPPTSAGS